MDYTNDYNARIASNVCVQETEIDVESVLKESIENGKQVFVKKEFTQNHTTYEDIWVQVNKFDTGVINGILVEDPKVITNVKSGTDVILAVNEIKDIYTN